MFMAIAVETRKNPNSNIDYRIWYLEVDQRGSVINIGVKSKTELIAHMFDNFKKYGETHWRAFLKGAEKSTPIEIFDFVSMNMHENTHFGTLPTLAEFQTVLDALHSRFELRASA